MMDNQHVHLSHKTGWWESHSALLGPNPAGFLAQVTPFDRHDPFLKERCWNVLGSYSSDFANWADHYHLWGSAIVFDHSPPTVLATVVHLHPVVVGSPADLASQTDLDQHSL